MKNTAKDHKVIHKIPPYFFGDFSHDSQKNPRCRFQLQSPFVENLLAPEAVAVTLLGGAFTVGALVVLTISLEEGPGRKWLFDLMGIIPTD